MRAPLDGTTQLITGASSGIGAELARLLAPRAGTLILVARRTDRLETLATELRGLKPGLTVQVESCDLADAAALGALVARLPPVDILINNSGMGDIGLFERSDAAKTDLMMRVNMTGLVQLTRLLLPGMVERGSGDIVATASVAGIKPIALDPAYGLTKHAVVGFVRSVAEGMNRPGAPDVCVSAICPGYTETGIIGDRIRDRIAERGVELMTPEYVASVVVRAVTERAQGAQWVIWPGVEPSIYDWNPGIPS